MSTTTYRAIIRELKKASTSSSAARNELILSNLRALFKKRRTDEEMRQFQYDVQNALTFMHSQRMYKVLLDRYNPLHDLSTEERIKATARRVGLDTPVTPDSEEKN